MPEQKARRHRPAEPSRHRDTGPPEGERLQRVLARLGYGSRRGVEQLIVEGRVRIGERVAQLGNRVDPARDQVSVDGVPVAADPELRYFALNKPAGVTSTLRDPHATRTIAELLPEGGPRLVPVGRLDRDSEGLLLLTNDGDLAHRLQHPRFGIEKEYLVEVDGDVPQRVARLLVHGVELEDGLARALRARIVERRRGRTAVALVMGEGRKREIRRMLVAVGFRVRRLVRTRIGPVRLGRLPPGKVRPLGSEEVRDLYRVTGMGRARVG
jgi:23S rRNA pseudouridine2605 synthase